MDFVGAPRAYAGGVTTCQLPGSVAVCVQTCSGMKPSGVAKVRMAFRYGVPLVPVPLRNDVCGLPDALSAIAVPFVIIFSAANIIDTYSGLIAIYIAATLPFSTWMLKSFVDDLPREIEEAAMIDGRSRLMAHVTVTIPLMRGGVFATALFVFILNWSEFMFALVLSYGRISTIPVQLAKYVTATAGTLYGVQAALAVLAMIPLVLAGFAIQSHLARGMTFGAIKR